MVSILPALLVAERLRYHSARMKTYPDSVRYLYALGNELKTAKLGLDRVSACWPNWEIPTGVRSSFTLPALTARVRYAR